MTPRYAPRFAARKDTSQREVVETLTALGCSVCVLDSIAESHPDVLVGVIGHTYAIEVKNPNTADDFTPQQDTFWELWRGNPKVVLTSRDDALSWVQSVRDRE